MAVPLLQQVWAELLGAPDAVDRVRARGSAGLSGPLPVGQLAVGTGGPHLPPAQVLRPRAGPGELADQYLHLDAAHVGVEFGSERHLGVDGVPRAGGFAPLSRAWPTSDGWVRTHANYPHHRAALLRSLGVAAGDDDEATSPRLAAALAERAALDVEEAVTAAGGLAVAVRTPQEWSATPMGAAVARSPLVSLRRVGERAAPGTGGAAAGSWATGVEGARVLASSPGPPPRARWRPTAPTCCASTRPTCPSSRSSGWRRARASGAASSTSPPPGAGPAWRSCCRAPTCSCTATGPAR